MKEEGKEDWIWWKHGVIYHIYPLSFQDSDGDGMGDLRGIIRRIGYLRSLGIDGIWLSPIFKSPMFDGGYDVSDYRSIDPVFGTLDDFTELLEICHKSGIRVILDMILNHTSKEHPWFVESAASLYNPKRNWYIRRSGPLGAEPSNWRSAVGGSAWQFDPVTGQYYMHSFFREQPDLNWREPEVPAALFGEMKYWLDLGVDGFRLDVINMVAKDRKFRNNPWVAGLPFLQQHRYTRNRKRSLRIVAKVRELMDQYQGAVAVGEVYSPPPGDARNAARYLGKDARGIHLVFDFSLIFARWNARAWFRCIRAWYDCIPEGGWPCNVLSNHDLFRSINRQPLQFHREEKAKVAAILLLTMHGTPFIYYGEEIGMHNARIARRHLRDPLGKKFWPLFAGRDRARTPMQWDAAEGGGFTAGNPWLPLHRDTRRRNVRKQEADPDSLLSLYRNLIRLRREQIPLQRGSWTPAINGTNGVLAYYRKTDNEWLLVVLNFTSRNKQVSLPEHTAGEVLLSTVRRAGEQCYLQRMRIAPFEASVWLIGEPARK